MNTGPAYLTHARLVTPDGVIDDAAVLIDAGRIKAVCPHAGCDAHEIDLNDALLMPGLIDLHNDTLQTTRQPRGGVALPTDFALQQVDRYAATSGITTLFHGISFLGSAALGQTPEEAPESVARDVSHWAGAHGTLIDHRVHVRYELPNAAALPAVERLIDQGVCGLISLMDHRPGQGQFKDQARYVRYLRERFFCSVEQAQRYIAENEATADDIPQRAARLAKAARDHGLALASHDDDSAARVEQVHRWGATISEFPMNRDAARAAKAHGHAVAVGAPNVYRGASQCGGPRASHLIGAGLADVLCSDYLPAALLPAVFRIAEELAWHLGRAVALASAHPAAAAGLSDRGRIEPGYRADLIAVDDGGPLPRVTHTFVDGVNVCRFDAPAHPNAPTQAPLLRRAPAASTA